MATRASRILQYVLIRPYTVAAGQIVTEGFAVKHSGADDAIQNMAAVGDNCIGIALSSGVAGQLVNVAEFGAAGHVAVKVGTGGATRGSPAKYAADGLTNATVGGGTTKLMVYGQFMQTGVAGDVVGLNLGTAGFTVGS